MERWEWILLRRWLLALAGLTAGCSVLHPQPQILPPLPPPIATETAHFEPAVPDPSLKHASFVEACGTNPIVGMHELSVEALVDQVLARNPTLAQMTAAWQAASARYPQVVSLDDPMFAATVGPASIGSNDVDLAYRLEVSQKVPFRGKLKLRGQTALAEAAAAGDEIADARLQLIESAKIAFYDYYLVDRTDAVNEENLKLLKDLRETAESRYKNRLSPEQDLRQADVEIGKLSKRTLMLERMRKVTQARINTLMNLPPEAPLPPPPKTLQSGEALPDVETLRTRAVSLRPDLQALVKRIEADRSSLALAFREYYPDFEFFGAYDAFWQRPEEDLRPQLAVRLNVPLRKEKRRGAVAEAQARLAQRVAELTGRTNQVNLEVQEAYHQAMESEKGISLFEKTILPAALENVRAARSAYTANQIPFLSLIEAQRNLVGLRDSYYEELAEYFRRRATLERVVAEPIERSQSEALPEPKKLPN